MTVVIGAVDTDGTITIGADTLALSGDGIYPLATPKIVKVGDYTIGMAGDMAFVQHIAYVFDPPPTPEGYAGGYLEFMVRSFLPVWNKAAEDFNAIHGRKEDDQPCTNRALIAIGGHLFELDRSYYIDEIKPGEWRAIGSGEAYAQGAMDILYNRSISRDTAFKIKLAIESVSKFTTTVNSKIQIVQI